MNTPNDGGATYFKGTKNIWMWHAFPCMKIELDQKRKNKNSFANFTLGVNKKIIYKLSSNVQTILINQNI